MTYFKSFQFVNKVFSEFSKELEGQKSEVNLWSHHFDMSLVWFTGRIIPGKENEPIDYAAEQMTFGFAPGDAGIPEPYFYAYTYPWKEDLLQKQLTSPAYWHTQGWNGAVLLYNKVVESSDPDSTLKSYLREIYKFGREAFKL